MVEKRKRKESNIFSRISSKKMWEQTDPVVTITSAIHVANKPWWNENDVMKGTKRKILLVNIAAIVICIGLLINRTFICIKRYLTILLT